MGGVGHKPPIDEDEPDIPGIKVIYDADEVIRVTKQYHERVKEITPDDIRAALREQGVTAKDWLEKGSIERRALDVNGLQLKAIGKVFGIQGDPKRSDVFIQLCRAIWGDAEVDQALRELGKVAGGK